MKRLCCLLGLAAVLGGCGGPDFDDPETLNKIIAEAVFEDELLERGPEGAKLLYVSNKQTPYSGWAKWMYSNGQVEILMQFHEGRKHGAVVTWHNNGQKSGESEVKDGKLDGVAERWYENGQKRGEMNWKDGLIIDGVCWKPNGEKGSEVIDGNGVFEVWFENGQKRGEMNWKDGETNGLEREWNEDGKLIRETIWKNGEIISSKRF